MGRGRAEHLGPARRRGPVLDAALTVFARAGFEPASMAAIADVAGVSKAVLYDCFPGGKQELYYTLLERGEEEFTQHLDAAFGEVRGRPLEQALREGLDAFLSYAEVNPRAFRLIFGAAGTAEPAIAARVESVRERVVAGMRDRAISGLGFATVPPPMVELYVRAVVAVAEELARWSLRDPGLSRPAMVDLIVPWFMGGFGRLLPPPPT